ncbi:putative AC transposase [Tanacetum coccineum]
MQPRYTHLSRSTLKRDAMKLWLAAKQEIIDSFGNINACVNLTTDVWSAPHGVPGSYMCVTAHWIEPGTWQMMKWVISFDIISVQASSVAFESAFSTSGRVLSIRRTRLTPASLEMCMCLKDHLDAKERKQDKCPLETPLDFEEGVFDDEVQQNEAIPLSDEEIALDASSEGTLSPGGPRYDYMMSSEEAEDDY